MKKVDYRHFGRFAMPGNLTTRGDELYFTQKRANFDKNKYDSDLYRLSGDKLTRMTTSGDVGSYWLLDDGIVFASLRSDDDREAAKSGRPLTVLQRLPYGGGEAEEYMRLPFSLSSAIFLPDGRSLLTGSYSARYEAVKAAAGADEAELKKALGEERDYEVFDELPFWANGQGVCNKVRTRLYLREGGEIKPLGDQLTDWALCSVSPDRSKALYTSCRYESVTNEYNRLILIDLNTLEQRDISLGDDWNHMDARFLPDGSLLTAATDMKLYGLNQNPCIYRIDLTDGHREVLYDEGYYSFWTMVNTDIAGGRSLPAETLADAEKWYFLSTEDDSCGLYSLDLASRAVARVTRARGCVQEAVPFGDGFAAVAARGLGGFEIYEIGKDGAERRLTELNTALSEYEAVEPLDLTFINAGGQRIRGFAIPPAGCEKGKKYPTILDIHGGPKTIYGNIYMHEMQLWASMGYAVIFCNPTGSDGGGDRFSDLRGKYGGIDYDDIMDFVDHALVSFDFIDPDRMGVTGGSYGGFMTNWIIGHTDRFKAAAAQRSISNWVSFAGVSDIGPHFAADQTAGDIWASPDKMWEQSPLKYADRAVTPTLFIHSDEDYRCPLEQGLQMFSALRVKGVDSRLCLFHGENHELSRSGKPLHRVRRLKEITEWFDKYLRADS